MLRHESITNTFKFEGNITTLSKITDKHCFDCHYVGTLMNMLLEIDFPKRPAILCSEKNLITFSKVNSSSVDYSVVTLRIERKNGKKITLWAEDRSIWDMKGIL